MRRFQNFLPSAALACLATLALAQDPAANPAPGPAPTDTTAATAAPEDIAAKAMAAMDALNAPAEKTEKPDKTKASDNSGKPDKSSAKKAKPAPPGTPASGTSKTTSKSPAADPASPGAAAAADDDNDDTPGGPDIIPPPPEDGRGMDMMSRSRMDMMVPPGRSHRGVHYPMYRALEGDRGEVDPALAGAGTVGSITAPLESLFESEIVTRLDNDHIQFDRAKWVQFDEVINPDGTPKPSMSLEIERGVYDMKNDILMTNQPVRIENKQFLIEGDTMLHDRASGLTRLTGRVRMTFFNQDPAPPPMPPRRPHQSPPTPRPLPPRPVPALRPKNNQSRPRPNLFSPPTRPPKSAPVPPSPDMKSISLRSLPLWSGILGLGLSAAFAQAPKPAAADAPKPAPTEAPKPPVHKPEQSALNLVKQENRTTKQLKEVIEDLRKAEKNNEAAEKELKRINSKDLKDDPSKVLDSVKDKLSPEDTAALKSAMEKAKSALDTDEVKKLLDDAKKKAAAAASSKNKSQPTTPPEKFGPSTFDQVPAPIPVKAEPVTAKVRSPGSTVTGDTITFPPTSDPANPQKTIPASDPRSRTYIVTGSAQVKTPTLVLDADRIECIASQDGGGDGIGGLGKSPPKSKKPTNKIDPVQAGIGATGDEAKSDPFDRIIATGRVNIVRIDKGKVVTGKGGSMIYEKKTGQMILTDWPEAQDGKNVIVAREKNAKIVIVPNGQSYGTGTKVLTMDEAKARTGGTPTPDPAAPPKATPVPPRAEPVR